MMETVDTIAAVMHISQKYLEGISSSAQHIRCLYDSSKERDISYFRIRNAFASFYRTASSETSHVSQIYAESQLMMVIGTLMMYFASEPTARIASGLTPQQSRKFNKILMHIENACRGRGYESMLSFFLFQKAYDDGFSRVSDKKTSRASSI